MSQTKKLHHQVIDKAKEWDEKMKKYKFYKEVVKDFLLMIPLLGSVGGTVLNWLYNSYVKYVEVASITKSRVAEEVGDAVEAYSEASATVPITMGEFVRDIFLVWLIGIIVWRFIKKIRAKKDEVNN